MQMFELLIVHCLQTIVVKLCFAYPNLLRKTLINLPACSNSLSVFFGGHFLSCTMVLWITRTYWGQVDNTISHVTNTTVGDNMLRCVFNILVFKLFCLYYTDPTFMFGSLSPLLIKSVVLSREYLSCVKPNCVDDVAKCMFLRSNVYID